MIIKGEADFGPMDRTFAELKRRADDHRQPFMVAGDMALEQFKKAYDTKAGWEPNAGKNPILEQTGALKQSYINKSSPNHVHEIDQMRAQFGSRDPKAAIHQTGGKVTLPDGRIVDLPARPVLLPPSEAYLQALADAEHDHFIVENP